MRNIGILFIVTAALFASFGMMWGIYMAISGEHMTAPAHAHLNLIGWVTMALFGLYYAITPAAQGSLARIHYVLHTSAVLCFTPGIVLAVRQGGEALAAIGSFLVLGSMLVFLFTVLSASRRIAA